jgi:hypothetical protein
MSRVFIPFRTLSRVASFSRGTAVSGAAQPAILLPVGAQLAGADAACPGPFCQGEAAAVRLNQSSHQRCAWDKFGFHGRVVAWAVGAVMRRAARFLTHGVAP